MLNQHRLMELAKTQAEANHNYIIGLLILSLDGASKYRFQLYGDKTIGYQQKPTQHLLSSEKATLMWVVCSQK